MEKGFIYRSSLLRVRTRRREINDLVNSFLDLWFTLVLHSVCNGFIGMGLLSVHDDVRGVG